MCIKSEGRAIFLNMQPVIKRIRPFCFHQKIVSKGCLFLPWGFIYMYEIKQNIIQNNEAMAIFLELVQNDGNNKSFKMPHELVPSGCIPLPCGFFQMMTLGWPWLLLWQRKFVPDASVWVELDSNIEHWVLLYFQVCSNSTYPQHSGER